MLPINFWETKTPSKKIFPMLNRKQRRQLIKNKIFFRKYKNKI